MVFTVPMDFGVKLKECERRDEYLDFDQEQKIMWNTKVTIIPILISALKTVTKKLEDLEIMGWM